MKAWNEASMVKLFIMPNSLKRTILAVFIFEGSSLNLQEKYLNMEVSSDNIFGMIRILK